MQQPMALFLAGVSGLPISQIQINPGFTPPGNIIASESGDQTIGYPTISYSFTNVYEFSEGWFKGLELGASVSSYWRYKYYYYYGQGVTPTGAEEGRALFYLPDSTLVNPILGYSRKFGRIVWSTHLNISNVFEAIIRS